AAPPFSPAQPDWLQARHIPQEYRADRGPPPQNAPQCPAAESGLPLSPPRGAQFPLQSRLLPQPGPAFPSPLPPCGPPASNLAPQAPSFRRFAILFFCMEDEPPTMGRLTASRI